MFTLRKTAVRGVRQLVQKLWLGSNIRKKVRQDQKTATSHDLDAHNNKPAFAAHARVRVKQTLLCLPRAIAGKGPANFLDYLQQPFSEANSCPGISKGRGQQEDAESLCAAVWAGTCFRY